MSTHEVDPGSRPTKSTPEKGRTTRPNSGNTSSGEQIQRLISRHQ